MHTIFKIMDFAFWIGVVGVTIFFLYIEVKQLLIRLKKIDARYQAEMRKLDEEYARKRAKLDAEAAAFRIEHNYKIRELYEKVPEPEIASSLEVGDWVVWVPLYKPVADHCGQIIEADRGNCCFKIRHLVDGHEMEDWHNCSQGAKMRKTNALDILTRELAN